jgi:hypothetical protein
MSTLWTDVYLVFFNKIEKDADFFSYNNVPTDAALDIAKQRSNGYLKESIAKLTLNCTPDIDFNDIGVDVTDGEFFKANLTNVEIDLLASLMREKLFDKDLSLLKAFQNRFTPKDMTVFSPSSERRTFVDMLKEIVKENLIAISQYSSRDRITGKLKMINFSSYYSE